MLYLLPNLNYKLLPLICIPQYSPILIVGLIDLLEIELVTEPVSLVTTIGKNYLSIYNRDNKEGKRI